MLWFSTQTSSSWKVFFIKPLHSEYILICLLDLRPIVRLTNHCHCIYALVNRVGISSDYGLSPIRRQAIIWTNAGQFLIRPLGITFSEVLIKKQNFSFTKMHPTISSAKWRPFCPGTDVLRDLSGAIKTAKMLKGSYRFEIWLTPRHHLCLTIRFSLLTWLIKALGKATLLHFSASDMHSPVA